jgi:hypothetical protein
MGPHRVRVSRASGANVASQCAPMWLSANFRRTLALTTAFGAAQLERFDVETGVAETFA